MWGRKEVGDNCNMLKVTLQKSTTSVENLIAMRRIIEFCVSICNKG